MGSVIPLFARQTRLGAGDDYCSEPFEVSGFASVNLELQVPGFMNAGEARFRVQTAANLSTNDWQDNLVFPTLSASPTLLVTLLGLLEMARFVRAKLTLTGTGVGITFSLIGVARERGS